MTWTYTSDPAGTPRDTVRWHLGDTDEKRPLAQDEDIDFALLQEPNPRLAAAIVATVLAAQFDRVTGISIAGLSIDMAKRAEQMRALAVRLRAEASGGGNTAMLAPVIVPVLTGATQSAVDEARADPDRIPLAVERDFPGDLPETTLP